MSANDDILARFDQQILELREAVSQQNNDAGLSGDQLLTALNNTIQGVTESILSNNAEQLAALITGTGALLENVTNDTLGNINAGINRGFAAIDKTASTASKSIADIADTGLSGVADVIDSAAASLDDITSAASGSISQTTSQAVGVLSSLKSEVSATTLTNLALVQQAADNTLQAVRSLTRQQLDNQISQQQLLQAAVGQSLTASFEVSREAIGRVSDAATSLIRTQTLGARSIASVIESESDQTQIILQRINSNLSKIADSGSGIDISSVLSGIVSFFRG